MVFDEARDHVPLYISSEESAIHLDEGVGTRWDLQVLTHFEITCECSCAFHDLVSVLIEP